MFESRLETRIVFFSCFTDHSDMLLERNWSDLQFRLASKGVMFLGPCCFFCIYNVNSTGIDSKVKLFAAYCVCHCEIKNIKSRLKILRDTAWDCLRKSIKKTCYLPLATATTSNTIKCDKGNNRWRQYLHRNISDPWLSKIKWKGSVWKFGALIPGLQ